MPLKGLAEFERAALEAPRAIQLEWRDKAVRLAEFAYGRLVQNTEDSGSVDTGAYRAEHVIEQDGAPIFEHPERPGPTAQLPARKRFGQPPLIDAPNVSSVSRVLSGVLQIASFGFVNRRFYADTLENGSARNEPRAIYARARDATGAFAQSLAHEPSQSPEMRRLEARGGRSAA